MPSTGRLVPVVMERTTALVPVLAVCCSCREQFPTRDLGRIVGLRTQGEPLARDCDTCQKRRASQPARSVIVPPCSSLTALAYRVVLSVFGPCQAGRW